MVDVGGQPIDRYVVLQHLSEGGMGAIYVGKKLGAGGFEMEVVLKQLLPEFTQQEEFIDLFLREAKLSATLDHANIIHTIDLVTAGGEYFIVMEYLPGGDLRTLLKRAKRRGKRFSPAAAIYITREVLSALAYAHVKRDFTGTPLKLIHRDVSPSNILLSYAGEVKLTDFGIAKAATHTSQFYKVKGKIGYMSPEQAKSESLDSRSDLYSLAVCLYEILTGERLFIHAGLTTSADEIYSQPVPSLVKKVPGLPAELDKIMQRALAIDPATRYQTAGELNEALTRAAHRNGLLMSAPELAKELLENCGPTEQWREEDDDDEIIDQPRAGTEIYDISEEDDDDGEAADGDERSVVGLSPMSIHAIAARAQAKIARPRTPAADRPKTEVGKFQGVELTSIINMMDVEGGTGMRAISDVDSGPKYLDSPAPRFLESSEPKDRLDSIVRSLPPPVTPLPPMPAIVQQPLMNLSRPVTPSAPVPMAPMPAPPQQPAAYPVQRTVQGVGAMAPPKRAPDAPRDQKSAAKRTRRSLMPLIVIVAVLLAAGVAAVVVAMSGPSLTAEAPQNK